MTRWLTMSLVGVTIMFLPVVVGHASDPARPRAIIAATSGRPLNAATTKLVDITFYGAYDNDPRGSRLISDPVVHDLAGGTGTFADPLTFASPAGDGEYPFGTRIYVPRVRKYFVREDECARSWTARDGCGPVSHVDLYMGNPSTDKSVLDCEDDLTPDGRATVVVDPEPDLPVSPRPLWDETTGTCGQTFPHKDAGGPGTPVAGQHDGGERSITALLADLLTRYWVVLVSVAMICAAAAAARWTAARTNPFR